MIGVEVPWLTGDHVVLRPLSPQQVSERYLRWVNDPQVNRYTDLRGREHLRDEIERYVASVSVDPLCAIWGIYVGTEHIGNVKFGPLNPIDRHAVIGILVGERDQWGRGYATEAIRLATRYAFDIVGLHRLEAGFFPDYERSLRAFEKAGYVRECVMRGRICDDGRFVDQLIMAMTNDA